MLASSRGGQEFPRMGEVYMLEQVVLGTGTSSGHNMWIWMSMSLIAATWFFSLSFTILQWWGKIISIPGTLIFLLLAWIPAHALWPEIILSPVDVLSVGGLTRNFPHWYAWSVFVLGGFSALLCGYDLVFSEGMPVPTRWVAVLVTVALALPAWHAGHYLWPELIPGIFSDILWNKLVLGIFGFIAIAEMVSLAIMPFFKKEADRKALPRVEDRWILFVFGLLCAIPAYQAASRIWLDLPGL